MLNHKSDPFSGLDIEQIANLPEDRFRYFTAHRLTVISQDIRELKKRPEKARANLSLFLSGCFLVIGILAFVFGG